MTMGFFLAPFAGGALVASLLAALGASTVVVWGAFLIASLVMFMLIRPIARRHRELPGELRTGSDALLGKEALVIERISNDESSGCVKINGEIWTARSADQDVIIDPGVRVQVLEIRGATAVVSA